MIISHWDEDHYIGIHKILKPENNINFDNIFEIGLAYNAPKTYDKHRMKVKYT